MASFTDAGAADAPAAAELNVWRKTIAERQQRNLTPEQIARSRAVNERQLRLAQHAKKGARLEKCTKMSRAAVAGSMMSFGSASAPAMQAAPAFGGFGAGVPAPAPASGFGGFSFGAAPSAPPAAPAARTADLFGAVSAPRQTAAMACANSAQAKTALESLKNAALADDDEAGEELVQAAQLQLSAAGHAWAARGDE